MAVMIEQQEAVINNVEQTAQGVTHDTQNAYVYIRDLSHSYLYLSLIISLGHTEIAVKHGN